jgi:hypothetical protein
MSTDYVFDRVDVYAYARPTDLVLISGSLCVGFEGYTEPEWEFLAPDAPASVMGEHVQRAFARCRTGVTEPPTQSDVWVKRLGAKSWGDMVKRMQRVSMSRSMRTTRVDVHNLIPKGRNGAFGSFHRVVDLHDTQALGQALWDALRTTT